MPLQRLFHQQIATLRAFLAAPGEKVRIVLVDPDILMVLMKVLAGIEKDPQCPDVMAVVDVSFDGSAQYLASVRDDVFKQYTAFASGPDAVQPLAGSDSGDITALRDIE